jgi:hypothetical protein
VAKGDLGRLKEVYGVLWKAAEFCVDVVNMSIKA